MYAKYETNDGDYMTPPPKKKQTGSTGSTNIRSLVKNTKNLKKAREKVYVLNKGTIEKGTNDWAGVVG